MYSLELPDPGSLQPLFLPEEADGILWWISTLGCGGAERQVIVTGREFARRGIPVALACQRLFAHRGDTHYLEQAKDIFTAVHDLTPVPSKARRRRKEFIRETVHEWSSRWKSLPVREFFSTAHLLGLAKSTLLRSGKLPRHIPGPVALAAARKAALPFRQLFAKKEYAALVHHTACFVELKPAVLHVWSAEQLYVPVAAVLAGVPRVIVSARVTTPQQRAVVGVPAIDATSAYILLTWLLRFKGVSLAANSRTVASEFSEWLGLDVKSVAVTPNIFETEQWPAPLPENIAALRRQLGIPENAQVIGGLARFVPQKDPMRWIETVRQVLQEKKDVYAVLGGNGEMLEQCRRHAASTPEGSRIILPGRVDRVQDFYGMLSVFLLTSRSEGLPNVLLEAQYAGVPVVSTDVGGSAEVVVHGETGWIENRSETLAERILFILENKQWAAVAGKVGSQRVQIEFSKEKASQAILFSYNTTIMNE